MLKMATAVFQDPPAEFRPLQIVHGFDGMLRDSAQLTGEDGIDARLELLKRMGVGGVVANVGFRDYLQSPRQWEIFRYGLRRADELGLQLWWYDEKGYPSGTAGALVTRANPECVALGLAAYRFDVQGPAAVRYALPPSCQGAVAAFAVRDPDTTEEADRTDLTANLDADGRLTWAAPMGNWTVFYLARRVMYEGTHSAANVCEFKHYVNVLDPRAVRAFLRITHERYLEEVPPELWGRLRAVFTDEPSFMTAYVGELPEVYRGKVPVVDAPIFTDRPPAVPWLDDLPALFRRSKGYDLMPRLYALFCSGSPEACYTRQDYYDFITELYADTWHGAQQRWCRAHGQAYSGHVLAEEGLVANLVHQGSLMAVIRRFDLPGIDMLNADPRDMQGWSFLAPKQVSSGAHLVGAREIHCEASDWLQRNNNRPASLAERRGQGNILYALGVNQITAYWSWGDIGEEAYRAYNDYMGRLALFLRGGRHVCPVAVLYPIRSCWALYTPSCSDPRVKKIEADYTYILQQLLQAQVDYDVIDEQALIEGEKRDGTLRVADEAYQAIVLPSLAALDLEAARAIEAFAEAGGAVLAVADLPALSTSEAATRQAAEIMKRLFTAAGPGRRCDLAAIPAWLRKAGLRDLELAHPDPDIIYTHRERDGTDIYFIANGGPDSKELEVQLSTPGPYRLYRPLGGVEEPANEPLRIALDAYEGVVVARDRTLTDQHAQTVPSYRQGGQP